MRKLLSFIIVAAMLLALMPAVLAAEPGVPVTVAQGTASAEADMKFLIPYDAEENGTLTVTVGDGNADWVSDIYIFDDWDSTEPVSGNGVQTYSLEVVPGSYYVRVYGPLDGNDLTTAISNIPYKVTFTPSGVPVGPVLDDYLVADGEFTEAGTYDVTVSADVAEVTLYTFAPAATGTYEIELLSGNAELSLWSTASYTKIADAENGAVSLTASAVGQSWFVALDGELGAAQIKITKSGEAPVGPSYESVMYENKQTPILFDDSLYALDDFVDYTDSVIDTAVLGADGYYHLNSADGPLLYADFFGVEPSLGTAWSFGSVSYVTYEGGEIDSVIDYQDALGAYLMASNTDGFFTYKNSYHPLTADLIEMIKNIGINNGWYGEEGLVGNTEDAWMFACVTMVSEDNEGGNTGSGVGGNTGSGVGGNTGSGSTTGGETGTGVGGNTGSNTETGNTNTGNTGGESSDKLETPNTGDLGLVAMAFALLTSAAGAAIVAKKKED